MVQVTSLVNGANAAMKALTSKAHKEGVNDTTLKIVNVAIAAIAVGVVLFGLFHASRYVKALYKVQSTLRQGYEISLSIGLIAGIVIKIADSVRSQWK